MTVEEMERTEILYEGLGADEALLGAVQANFLARRQAGAGTEVAVFVNHPALAFLAETLARENTPEFGEEMARRLGEAWIAKRHEMLGRFEPLLFISRATLDSNPELIDAVRAAGGAEAD